MKLKMYNLIKIFFNKKVDYAPTREHRLKIYRGWLRLYLLGALLSKIRIKLEILDSGLCHVANETLHDILMIRYKYFPELLMARDEMKYNEGRMYWWPAGELKPRIQVLRDAIRLTRDGITEPQTKVQTLLKTRYDLYHRMLKDYKAAARRRRIWNRNRRPLSEFKDDQPFYRGFCFYFFCLNRHGMGKTPEMDVRLYPELVQAYLDMKYVMPHDDQYWFNPGDLKPRIKVLKRAIKLTVKAYQNENNKHAV